MDEWRMLIDSPRPAAAQMRRDEELAGEGDLALRLFQWDPPAISLGRTQAAPAWYDAVQWRAMGLEAVKRPTGGGIAFHGSDLSLTVVVPRMLQRPLAVMMEAVTEATVRLCEAFGATAVSLPDVPRVERITYCLIEPSPYAVFIDGFKVAGFAIRRMACAWLIQGSLLVQPLPAALRGALPEAVAEAFDQRAVALSEAVHQALTLEEVQQVMADQWRQWWEAAMLTKAGVLQA